MEFRTLDDVITYDRELGRRIDELTKRLADRGSLPRLSSQARLQLNRRLERERRRRQELREDYCLRGVEVS